MPSDNIADSGVVGEDAEAEVDPTGQADAAEEDAGDVTVSNEVGAEGDTSVPMMVPSIGEGLDCRRQGGAGGLSPGDELQRHLIDLSIFPDAHCNDGSAAVIYFRPYVGEMNRDRWILQLQGGGSCRSPQSCANRWCSVDTNFGAQQMTSQISPAGGIDGFGILSRQRENPFGNGNQVFIKYCSSDGWSGVKSDVVVDTFHPERRDEPVQFRMSFRGVAIIDAALATLQGDGAAPLVYSLDGGSQEMPDLDDASFVFFTGASAGGGGVTFNADRVGEYLESTNNRCLAGDCSLDFRALMDSSFGPSLERLDFSATSICLEQGLCDYESFMTSRSQTTLAFNSSFLDASCLAYHPEDEWRCFDSEHVIEHHVTSPFFVRIGQSDSLKSSGLAEAMFRYEGMDFQISWFSEIIREQLAGLGNIKSAAHEGGAIDVTPGWFGPTCSKHETLRNNPNTFNVMIRQGDEAYAMFDVISNWIQGEAPSGVIAQSPDQNTCP